MKFIIRRTSEWNHDVQPCIEAKRELVTWLDRRTAQTIEQARSCLWFKDWWEWGENHREENGMIVCDRKKKDTVWTIEFNSLEELIAFENEHGQLVIGRTDSYKGYDMEIEIYDGYRE